MEMFVSIFASNQDIIQIGIATRESMKDLIDKLLKGLCSINQAKGHMDKSKEAEWSNDNCLRNVLRFHWNLMVRPHQIYLREDSGPV